MATKYRPQDVTVEYGGVRLIDFLRGTFVDVARPTNDVETFSTIDGRVIFVNQGDKRVEVTLNLAQTSTSNDHLDARSRAQRRNDESASLLVIRDLNGSTKLQGYGYVTQRPGQSFSDSVEARGWVITIEEDDASVVGGAVSALP